MGSFVELKKIIHGCTRFGQNGIFIKNEHISTIFFGNGHVLHKILWGDILTMI